MKSSPGDDGNGSVSADRVTLAPCLIALAIVGLVLGGLLVGWEPVGNDPDAMYRPIKSELARSLREGRLPFWSDRFGVGVPLLAESHAAALYPPNLILYRLLDPAHAFRLSMWLHYLLLVAATFAYARTLGVGAWGSALAALAFTLCGFQAVHAVHEPFYHVLPFLPLALLLTERFLATGRLLWLASLALVLGVQWMLGHFQIQVWTNGLVIVFGLWRAFAWERPWRRVVGLLVALAWGLAIASVQLNATRELVRESGFRRSYQALASFAFPPAHLAQPAAPRLFWRLSGDADDPYWKRRATGPVEACFYVGTLPLLLAGVGLLGRGRSERALAPWKLVLIVSLALASMPHWWPDGYLAFLQLPVLGLFRAPARYTMLASLALCLLAGRGMDRALSGPRFELGVWLALLLGAASVAWAWAWWSLPEHRASLPPPVLRERLLWVALAWAVSLAAVLAWRLARVSAFVPLAVTAIELGLLYYAGPVPWGWSVDPKQSPVLRWVERQEGAGLVAGRVFGVPVRVGLAAAAPYMGITPPPPNYLLADLVAPKASFNPDQTIWMRRFGVSHGIWYEDLGRHRDRVVFASQDHVLDRLVPRQDGRGRLAEQWRVVEYPGAYPRARVARRAKVVASWPVLHARLSLTDDPDEVVYLSKNAPAGPAGPRAKAARVVRWDGLAGEIAHDGVCDLVLRRTHYPGWFARIDGGPPRPVSRADGGLQAIRLVGSGTSHVSLEYHPTSLRITAPVSIAVAALALLVAAPGTISALRGRPRSSATSSDSQDLNAAGIVSAIGPVL
jgi:hypothetical protein